MTVLTLKFDSVTDPGDAFYIVRSSLEKSRPRGLHNHDFYELIWVQTGTIRHHMADFSEDLNAGDVIFIRPSDIHALQGRGDDPAAVSVLFDATLIERFGNRHGLSKLFWNSSSRPDRFHRDAPALAQLNRAADRLEQADRTTLEAEAFLTPLVVSLMDRGEPLPDDAPKWLRAACNAARDPEVFRDGAAGLVRVAGRAHPHVSRTMRRYLDQSPSDYVNAIRMDYAARQLTGTPDSLAEIAQECGIPNLSHFHKLFRARYNVTPHRYRKAHQRDIVQPEP